MREKYNIGDPDYIPKDITVREHNKGGGTNYGVVSLVVFTLAAVAGYWGYESLTEASCDWTRIGESIQFAIMGFYAAVFCWMVSIAIAGAGLATNRGSFLALLVLCLDFLPLLILGYVLVTGSFPDFMSTSSQSTSTDPMGQTSAVANKCG
ncbi:MAG: hypothetical protein H9W81_07840 [Enterococcus sp.]|nr:hypothetical protein [Enterococcus sp.]